MNDKPDPVKQIEYESKFVDYLLKKGYPPESIILNYRLGEYLVDVVVIDPFLKFPVAAFELKSAIKGELVDATVQRLIAAKQEFRPFFVPYYVVVGELGTKNFVVYEIVARETESVRSRGIHRSEIPDYRGQPDIPQYANVLNETRSRTVLSAQQEQREALDTFTRLCWLLGLFCLILFGLHVKDVIALDKTELLLLALCIALFLVPFAKKLKLPGIEWERDEKKK